MMFRRCKGCGDVDVVKDRLCDLCLYDRDVDLILNGYHGA
jgi:hypothetical protein